MINLLKTLRNRLQTPGIVYTIIALYALNQSVSQPLDRYYWQTTAWLSVWVVFGMLTYNKWRLTGLTQQRQEQKMKNKI